MLNRNGIRQPKDWNPASEKVVVTRRKAPLANRNPTGGPSWGKLA
jgi:hypothetical protein